MPRESRTLFCNSWDQCYTTNLQFFSYGRQLYRIPTSLFMVWFRPFNENSWILHRKSCWWKVILPFMLSEDHSVFRNTESKILGFSMILEHPLNAAFSNIRTHFIMTNFDTVGIFLYVISRMTFPIYFSKAFGSCGVFQ